MTHEWRRAAWRGLDGRATPRPQRPASVWEREGDAAVEALPVEPAGEGEPQSS